MRITPDRSLIIAAASWLGIALLAVWLPALEPALAPSAAALALGALLDAAGLVRTPAPVLERRTPPRLWVGRTARLALELRNPGPRELELELADELPHDLAGAEPHFERALLPAGGELRLEYEVTPCVRGRRALGPAVALLRSPLGLWRRRLQAGEGQRLDVYPDTAQLLGREALDPRRVLAVLGLRPARQRGEGMDFESLRDYVPGDDPRRIDWRASARRGRPVTRLYQHERSHTLLIALDTSRLMGGRSGGAAEPALRGHGRSKLDHAIDAALVLASTALAAGDRAGLLVFDRELRARLAPRSRRADLGLFVDALQPLQPRMVEADYRGLVREILVRHPKRALVVVLSDFVESDSDELVAPLGLLARRHQVLLVALRDRLFDPRAEPADRDPLHLYRRLVLDDLLREREQTLGRLRRMGLQTLDLHPEQLTPALLNRYLAL